MKLSPSLLTAALLATALSAQAQDTGKINPPCMAGRVHSAVNAVVYDAPDKAAPKIERMGMAKPDLAQVVELSVADAKALLASTEGPAWHVFQVSAPDCNPADLKKVRKVKKVEKVADAVGCEPVTPPEYIVRNVPSTNECRQIKKECATASKFAEKFNLHATCSTLYTRTTVLLSTDSALKQQRESKD